MILYESQFFPESDETGQDQLDRMKKWFSGLKPSVDGYSQDSMDLDFVYKSFSDDMKKIHNYLNDRSQYDIVKAVRDLRF